jgi:transcription elongation factor Elf1
MQEIRKATVQVPTDRDGFTSQECPVCRKRFKVVFTQGGGHPLAHCPYCGHSGEDCWWTEEQVQYFRAVAGKKFVTPMLQDSARNIERMNSPGSFLRFSAKVKPGPVPRVPVEPETEMPVVTFACCAERVKHDGTSRKLNCPICGHVTEVG